MEICHCRYCKKIFRSSIKRTCCDSCKAKDDVFFEKIKDYLDLFPNSNAMQVADGLNVEVTEIVRFIDEGRLTIVRGDFKKIDDITENKE